jgi:hypothetical protein
MGRMNLDRKALVKQPLELDWLPQGWGYYFYPDVFVHVIQHDSRQLTFGIHPLDPSWIAEHLQELQLPHVQDVFQVVQKFQGETQTIFGNFQVFSEALDVVKEVVELIDKVLRFWVKNGE